MPKPLATASNGESLLDKIGPGGKYYKYALWSVAAVGVIFLVILGFIFYPSIKNLVTPVPSSTPLSYIPRPSILPLPTGFQTWSSSYGPAAKGPKVQKITADTLSPPKGSTQTITVTIKNDSPVTSVKATVYTDYKIEDHDLTLVSGTPTNGTWSGIWRLNDTYDYIYHINFVMSSQTGTSTSVLSLR